MRSPGPGNDSLESGIIPPGKRLAHLLRIGVFLTLIVEYLPARTTLTELRVINRITLNDLWGVPEVSTVSRLALDLGLPQQTVSRVVTKIEASRFVTRERINNKTAYYPLSNYARQLLDHFVVQLDQRWNMVELDRPRRRRRRNPRRR